MTRCKGNQVNFEVPFLEGLKKCKDISITVEVDVVELLMVYVVDPYWFCQVCKLTSNDNVIR